MASLLKHCLQTYFFKLIYVLAFGGFFFFQIIGNYNVDLVKRNMPTNVPKNDLKIS